MAPNERPSRHLLLALLPVLMLSVWALSCGDPPGLPCAAYCTGCCTAEGVCTSTEVQGDGACGLDGATCTACDAGLSCVSGFCSDGTGPTCGARAQTCCPGEIPCSRGLTCENNRCVTPACGDEGIACCADNACNGDLTCQGGICRAEACGASGQTCCPGAVCDGTLTCAGGICGGSGGTAPIGAACTADDQCQLNRCSTAAWPDGYCTQACSSNTQCPGDSLCSPNPFNLAAGAMCLDTCDTPGVQSSCREGYVCERSQNRPGNPGVCIPRCDQTTGRLCSGANTCNAATGLCAGDPGFGCKPGGLCNNGGACGADGYCPTEVNPYGSPCTNGTQCAGGLCLPQQTSGSWTGGYCSGPCKFDETSCDAGGGCSVLEVQQTGANFCLAECTFNRGQSSCRDGYVCDVNWTDQVNQAVCVAACQSDAECVTDRCVGGFCCGTRGFACCNSGPACASGSTCDAQGICR